MQNLKNKIPIFIHHNKSIYFEFDSWLLNKIKQNTGQNVRSSFLHHLTEKPEQTFWPTQYVLDLCSTFTSIK